MEFTKIPKKTFDQLQINAGMLLKNFNLNPAEGESHYTDADEITATTGGITINVKPEFQDFGEDIDNCPKNTMELKRITSTEISLSGTALNITEDLLMFELGAADKDATSGAIKPRVDLKVADFRNIWWVGDMSDGGFIAVHVLHALSTDGFSLKTTDKGKGNIAFALTGHVSMENQDVLPVEIYVSTAEEEETNGEG